MMLSLAVQIPLTMSYLHQLVSLHCQYLVSMLDRVVAAGCGAVDDHQTGLLHVIWLI